MAILKKGMFILGDMVHGYQDIDIKNDDYSYRAYFVAKVVLNIDETDEGETDEFDVHSIDINQTDVVWMPALAWDDYILNGEERLLVSKLLRESITAALTENAAVTLEAYNEFA